MKEQLEVTDLKGNKIGVMNVSKNIDFSCVVQLMFLDIMNMEPNFSFFISRLRLLLVTLKKKSTPKLMICLWMHRMNLLEKKSILFSKLLTAEESQTNIR